MAFTQTIPYTTASNYTFDSALIEVTGGFAQLKDQRPANATIYMEYDSTINGNWGDGTLTGTAVGGAAIASNKLNLKGGTVKNVTYDATSNANSAQVGTVRFSYTPNYTGNPAARRGLFVIKDTSTSANNISLQHATNGNINLNIRSSADTNITASSFGLFSSVAGTKVEMELNWDLTAGATRLFIDGVQQGSTVVATGTRSTSADFLAIGRDLDNEASDAEYEDVIIFSTVQHTANYTSGVALPSTIFSKANPSILSNASVTTDSLLTFTETKVVVGSDDIQYSLNIGGSDEYFDGAAWVSSDGTFAQSNTAAVINTNITSRAFTTGQAVKIRAYLHGDDGTTQPKLDQTVFTYDFFAAEEADIAQTPIFVYLDDLQLIDVTNATLTVSTKISFFHGERLIPSGHISTQAANSEGYIEIPIIETTSVNKKLTFSLSYTADDSTTKIIKFKDALVPNDPTNGISLMVLTKVVKG